MKESKEKGKFIYAVGKRKTAIAQVRLYDKGSGKITINQKDCKQYFKDLGLVETIYTPLKLVDLASKLDFTIIVRGGGQNGQAEAIRHAISRALNKFNKDLRKTLKVAGFLKRDDRIKERKKPGLKRARRAPQWQKR